MSVKLYQNVINQVRNIIDSEVGIMDDAGLILACSNDIKQGQINSLVADVLTSGSSVVNVEGTLFQKVYIKNKLEFITFISHEDENSTKYLSLISSNALNMKTYYDEKYDKPSFIKSIIMDNILPGDITLKAKELHIVNNASRIVFLIKTEKAKDVFAYEVIERLFPGKTKDFVIIIDDETTVLIKELKYNSDDSEIDKISKSIVDTLSTELMIKTRIGIGTVVDSIRDVARSFKEAQRALHIGGIFDSEKSIINYNKLGIGRLIFQLPTTLCRLFLNEVFEEGSFESLDSETLQTIQKFFENNLNVSETSRQLYVHRNTLVYRLDKIQKITGLDLRMFDDAIIFKVAMLVKKYLDSSQRIV